MRKTILCVAVCVIALLWCESVWSAPEEEPARSIRASERFGRGLANIITSPLELPAQMYIRASYQHEYNSNPFATVGGFLEGIPMGVIYFGWRLAAGCFDVTTFPFTSYDRGIIDPEYLTFSHHFLVTD